MDSAAGNSILNPFIMFLITINKMQTEERLAALGRETVKIIVNDETVAQFDLEAVKALPKVLTDEGLNTSKGKEDIVFGGVLLKDVLKTIDFDYCQYQTVTYKAIDGYASPGTIAELDGDGVYLVYEPTASKTPIKPRVEQAQWKLS